MFCPKCGEKNEDNAKFCSRCGNQLPVTVSIVPPPAGPAQYAAAVLYAGFWKRLAAMLIDLLVLMVAAFVVGAVVGAIMFGAGAGPMEAWSGEALMNLLFFLIMWLYFAVMESSTKQATLGKMALGIKVRGLGGGRISFARASGRYFGKIISGLTLGIGYLMAGFTARKQALHDMIASCLVVSREFTAEHARQQPPDGLSTGAIVAIVVLGALGPVAILAAVAVPAFLDYSVRAKVVGVVVTGEQAARAVDDFVLRNNAMPTHIGELGLSPAATDQNVVKRITLDSRNGTIEIVIAFAPLEDKSVVFFPAFGPGFPGGRKCQAVGIPERYLPGSCR